MADDAPVCHVSTNQTITQPPARRLAAVPRATDLRTALQAINILQQNIQILAGQIPQYPNQNPSNPATSGVNSVNARPSQQPRNQPIGRWVESGRVTETVRIYNRDDREQYVDVKRINSLTMRDTVTGEQWSWRLK